MSVSPFQSGGGHPLSRSNVLLSLFLCLLSLLALSLYAERSRPPLAPDMERYLWEARQLRLGRFREALNYHYPPLFPALIVVADLALNDLEASARAVSLLAAAFTLIPVYFLSLRLFGRRAAVLAAGFLGFRFLAGLSLCNAEPLMLLLLALAFSAGWHAVAANNLFWFGITGLLFAAAFLTKAESQAYLAFFCGVTAITFLSPASFGAGTTTSFLRRLRRAGAALSALAAGFLFLAGPYLWCFYRDTGRLSLNPKARTLFLIHNHLYWQDNLYRLFRDENGLFTPAQRIYQEGDKKNLTAAEKSEGEKWGFWLREYLYRQRRFFGDHLLNFYLRPLAPGLWPVFLFLAFWPEKREKKGRGGELVFYIYPLVSLFLVPFFSGEFSRFYFSLLPWLAMVLGRGLDRALQLPVDKIPGGGGERWKKSAGAAAFILLAASAAGEILGVRPDKEYWNRYEKSREAAAWLEVHLPQGCRFMAPLGWPSLWYLAGFPPEKQIILPVDELAEVLRYGREAGVKFLMLRSGEEMKRYENVRSLLRPDFSHHDLSRRWNNNPAAGGYLIYELRNSACSSN